MYLLPPSLSTLSQRQNRRGKGQAIIKGINKFGPGIVEHGLPIAGQFVPREFDAELFEREFDEFEAREIDELD